MASMLLLIIAAAVFKAENLRQPTGQRPIGFDFMKRRVRVDRMIHYQFVAIDRRHAVPF
jgi:hypothetical protein